MIYVRNLFKHYLHILHHKSKIGLQKTYMYLQAHQKHIFFDIYVFHYMIRLFLNKENI